MRLTPLAFAIALTLAACSQGGNTRNEVAAGGDQPAAKPADASSLESTTVVADREAELDNTPAPAVLAEPAEARDELAKVAAVGGAVANAQLQRADDGRLRAARKAATSESYAIMSPPAAPPPSVGYAQA